jgi:small subunit ribosomal protein S8
MTDPITDMLNQIRNASAVLKPDLSVSFSNLKFEILRIMERGGFIGEVKKAVSGKSKTLKIVLIYEMGLPKISGLKRISKPGQRIYNKYNEIKRVKGGYGMAIISTPKGLMTDKEAKKQKLGGEVLCEIW